MKKIFFPLLVFLIVINVSAQVSDNYHIDNIEEKHIGVYLPINFVESLENTKNFTISMRINKDINIIQYQRLYHDILIVDKDRNSIWSNVGFHDGYAIPANEAENYKFIDNGPETTIIDDNGYKYMRISRDIENAYTNAENYIGNIVLKELIGREKILLKENIINVLQYNLNYRIDLLYFEDVNLVLRNNDNDILALRITDDKYVAYKTEGSLLMTNFRITDEVEFEL